jgi:two-component system OmpR family response regulator
MMTQYFKANILIVDDDIETLKLIETLFQKSGYGASSASNWEEVERIIKNAEKLRQRFDILVLDIMMPDLSGFDMCERLKLMLKPMPQVIFLSARSTMEDMIRASDLGAAKYLVKPTTPEKLLDAVRIALSR